MYKLIINTNLSEEQIERMRELFGNHPEVLEGREIEMENDAIAEELVSLGIAEVIEKVKSNDDINSSPEMKEIESGSDRPEEDTHANESESDIPKDEENREEEPLSEEQEKVVAERKEIIEKIINASSFEARDKVILLNAYCGNPNDLAWHFNADNYLEGTSAQNISGIDNLNAIHRLIRGAVNSNEDLGKAELDSERIVIAVPPDFDNDELSINEKAVAKEKIAQEIKRMMEKALYSNESPKKILLNIRNIETWANNNREAIAESLAPGAGEEAIREYIETVGKEEISSAIKTARDLTDDVQLSFDGIDWTNPMQSRKAIELLNEVTDGAPGDAIKSVKMDVAISDKTDIKEAAKVIGELEANGIDVEVDVSVAKDKELEKEATQELDATPEEKVISGVTKVGMAIAMGATAIDSLGLDEKEHEDEHSPGINFVPPIS